MEANGDEDANMEDLDDPVPKILRKHFDEALGAARTSVSAYDL